MVNHYNDSDNIFIKLKNGEKVTCPKCKAGVIVAVNNANPVSCHGFYCTKCDAKFHWDPAVVVE